MMSALTTKFAVAAAIATVTVMPIPQEGAALNLKPFSSIQETDTEPLLSEQSSAKANG